MIVRSGVVLSHQGTSPGLSSGITYTVRLDMDGSTTVIEGVVPMDGRWPAPYIIRAVAAGTAIEAHDVGGELRFMFHGAEKPDYYVCNP